MARDERLQTKLTLTTVALGTLQVSGVAVGAGDGSISLMTGLQTQAKPRRERFV